MKVLICTHGQVCLGLNVSGCGLASLSPLPVMLHRLFGILALKSCSLCPSYKSLVPDSCSFCLSVD